MSSRILAGTIANCDAPNDLELSAGCKQQRILAKLNSDLYEITENAIIVADSAIALRLLEYYRQTLDLLATRCRSQYH